MKTYIIVSIIGLMCLSASAQETPTLNPQPASQMLPESRHSTTTTPSGMDELVVGTAVQDRKTYLSQTDAAVIAHINEEIEMKCDENGCTFVSRTGRKKGWTVSFNAGVGNSTNNNGGTVIYANGTTQQNSAQPNLGFTLTYKNIKCETNLKISMDDFINQTARSIGQRESGTYTMKQLTSDDKFVELLKLEIYKQLASSGDCN